MAITTTTTNNLRYTFGMRNGDTRYIDIENPSTDTATTNANVAQLNTDVAPTGKYAGILVGEDFYNGDTDAVVTNVTKAEVIKIVKTTDTNTIYTN